MKNLKEKENYKKIIIKLIINMKFKADLNRNNIYIYKLSFYLLFLTTSYYYFFIFFK